MVRARAPEGCPAPPAGGGRRPGRGAACLGAGRRRGRLRGSALPPPPHRHLPPPAGRRSAARSPRGAGTGFPLDRSSDEEFMFSLYRTMGPKRPETSLRASPGSPRRTYHRPKQHVVCWDRRPGSISRLAELPPRSSTPRPGGCCPRWAVSGACSRPGSGVLRSSAVLSLPTRASIPGPLGNWVTGQRGQVRHHPLACEHRSHLFNVSPLHSCIGGSNSAGMFKVHSRVVENLLGIVPSRAAG